MNECNSLVTPSDVNVRLDDASNDEEGVDCPYSKLTGSLMYLTVATRPDIANTVSWLAQFTSKPGKRHWLAAKTVLSYLGGTANIGLLFKRTGKPLFGNIDADWGGSTVDPRSYTGYMFLLSGAAITWKSQKQKTVALSSTEVEYVSLAEGAKQAF
uniref:secreted RxLR effector protein 161-like n=1 Tax=Osmia lignaria TaxID=473952 RepID=UPI001478F56B|nr:secreted RxLR effector protein 161-like [Osmia lignaria]